MKKIIISVLSAALVFASCQKEAALVENGTKTVSFTATTPETRTSFAPKDGDSYPVLWTGDEKVSVSYNMAAQKSSGNTLAASADSKTATFSIDITADTEASEHNFYAVCPSSALLGVSADKGFNVQVPQSQVPGDGTCDESAQVIFANYSSSSFPTSATFNFKHIVAYGNLSITLPSGVSEISSITLESPVDIAGRFYYTAEGESTVNSGSKVITLNTAKTSDVFFACLPADLSGQSLKVIIAAGGNTYTKNISLTGKTLNFKKGHVSKFSVDMSGVSADAKVVYNLVTDPTTLKEGDKVIIAAQDADVALSTTQNGNNRAAADITKSGNTVVNPGAAVQILTLEKGTLDNTCAFNTGAGYLYAASSSSNQLKTQTTLDANGSFRISYADDVTTVMAKGKNSRNLLQYNNSNSIFSCYDSNQKEVVIYSDGKGTGAQLFSTAFDETPITPETPTFSSLADLVSKLEPTTDGTPVNVTLTNEKILSIYTTTKGYRNGIYLKAGDRQIEIYCQDVPDAWVEGGTVSGTLNECVWKNYNGTWELCPTNWTELTYTAPAGDTPATPTYASLADLVAAGEPTGGKVNVTLTNEEILSIYTTTKGYRNGIYLKAGDRQIEIYCQDVPEEWVEGGTVSGTLNECVWKNYNGTWELCPTNWTELTYTAPAGGGDAITFIWGDVASVNEWQNGIAYTDFSDQGITFTVAGGGNNGKYYTSDKTWRFYSGGSLTISAEGKTIKSVTSNPSQSFSISDGVATISFSASVRFTSIKVTL